MGGKRRGGNILGSLLSNFLNHARGGAHFPSPPLPSNQTGPQAMFGSKEGRGGEVHEREVRGGEGGSLKGGEGRRCQFLVWFKKGRGGVIY